MVLIYDGSFEGLLSAIFFCYERKVQPEDIVKQEMRQQVLFYETHEINTNNEQAFRVWKAWREKLQTAHNQLPFMAFLSEEKGIEMHLLRFAQLSFSSYSSVESNYSDDDILFVRKAAKRVSHEALRMIEFVRFRLTKDNIYFSGVSPRYDVLPMILYHFQDRFADQNWIVYDLKRDYGFFFDKKTTKEIELSNKHFNTNDGSINDNVVEEDEVAYQEMWSSYCQKITIRERLNLKVHRQHMPKRYWKFLPEKRMKIG